MRARTKTKNGVTIEPVGYLSVVAMSARSAISFFGLDENARAVDVGDPDDPARWKPGARRFRVYRSAADMPS
jgi:hypothetical protein